MKIKSVEAAGAFWRPSDKFPDSLPQVAFAGRSNVGKSSLVNRLLGRRKLAPISSTPGKTRKIHFYEINGRFFLVDLPGYGFARLPEQVRENWRRLIERYFETSRGLRGVVCLVDIRRGVGELDRQMLFYLAEKQVPLLIALTKADKLGRGARDKARKEVLAALEGAVGGEQVLLTSARTGEGCGELLNSVGQLTLP